MNARWPLVAASGLLLLILIAPLFAPADPMATDPAGALAPPDSVHVLGTDRLGRDVWSRLLYGGQRTILIAALATAIAVGIGTLLGMVGWGGFDLLTNALLAFPTLLLALVVMTLLGTGALSLALATGIALIAPFARVTRGAVRAVRDLPFIESARALGASDWRIFARHIAPNIAPTLLAYAGVIFAYSVLNSAALSFLGLGGDLGAPDWGAMLAEGRVAFRTAPWISAAPGLAITLLVWIVNRATTDRDGPSLP